LISDFRFTAYKTPTCRQGLAKLKQEDEK